MLTIRILSIAMVVCRSRIEHGSRSEHVKRSNQNIAESNDSEISSQETSKVKCENDMKEYRELKSKLAREGLNLNNESEAGSQSMDENSENSDPGQHFLKRTLKGNKKLKRSMMAGNETFSDFDLLDSAEISSTPNENKKNKSKSKNKGEELSTSDALESAENDKGVKGRQSNKGGQGDKGGKAKDTGDKGEKSSRNYDLIGKIQKLIEESKSLKN